MADTKTTALVELASGATADTDVLPIVDISDTTQGASGSLKKFSWGSLKSTLKTYFDGLYSTKGPAFSAYRSTSNQSITANTFTKVQLNTELFDVTNSFDSTTNYRFQPNVAGYYQVSFAVVLGASGSLANILSLVYKNGIGVASGTYTPPAAAVEGATGGSALVYMNGSTDYLELYAYASGTSPSVVTSIAGTYFTGYLARSV